MKPGIGSKLGFDGRAQLAGLRLGATVRLVKALGGGWNEQMLVAKKPSHLSAPKSR